MSRVEFAQVYRNRDLRGFVITGSIRPNSETVAQAQPQEHQVGDVSERARVEGNKSQFAQQQALFGRLPNAELAKLQNEQAAQAARLPRILRIPFTE